MIDTRWRGLDSKVRFSPENARQISQMHEQENRCRLKAGGGPRPDDIEARQIHREKAEDDQPLLRSSVLPDQEHRERVTQNEVRLPHQIRRDKKQSHRDGDPPERARDASAKDPREKNADEKKTPCERKLDDRRHRQKRQTQHDPFPSERDDVGRIRREIMIEQGDETLVMTLERKSLGRQRRSPSQNQIQTTAHPQRQNRKDRGDQNSEHGTDFAGPETPRLGLTHGRSSSGRAKSLETETTPRTNQEIATRFRAGVFRKIMSEAPRRFPRG